jgi:hypothetical protein
VEPLLALGKALQARGHAVTLCGPDNCASWVRDEHALGFVPLGIDFKALMQSREVREARGGIEAAIGKGVIAAMPAAPRAASDTADRVAAWTSSCVRPPFPAGRTSPKSMAPRSSRQRWRRSSRRVNSPSSSRALDLSAAF